MDEAFQILIAVLFLNFFGLSKEIELLFNSRDLQMAAENVNLVTRASNFKGTPLYRIEKFWGQKISVHKPCTVFCLRFMSRSFLLERLFNPVAQSVER